MPDIGDMPFMSYATLEQALQSAGRLIKAGAHMVKFEGDIWLAHTVRRLTENGVPMCVHLGLTPQSVNILGGFKVQGRDPVRAPQLVEAALRLEEAGATMLLVECLPSPAAESALEAYVAAVKGGAFPAGEHGYSA
jgi:3-methyl-2-oxobutanoate hydroxymethyltransferase